MTDIAKAAGTLYMWPHYIEASQNILSNPHYSFDDANRFTDRYLEEDEKNFLTDGFLEKIDTDVYEIQYQLTEKGKRAAYSVYDFIEERHNGDLQSFIDWEDKETVESLLTQ